ncbi:hypothetical protein HRbin06_00278 [archaeon HR06]|nr:hypothetical protein HRbin06_00278 [archaeon HR06]
MVKKKVYPFFIKLDSLKDLARLSCALERTPLPLFHYNNILMTQMGEIEGSPLFYYINTEEKNEYLAFRNNSGLEEVIFTDNAKLPTYTYSPIISLAKLPKPFEEAFKAEPKNFKKFTSIELKDLSSLTKICAYRLLFEETPLPIFAFKLKDKVILGTFSKLNENSEFSNLFFYLPLEDFPQSNYVRYGVGKGEVKFSNRIDETGYIFVKIVKLAKPHPLVDL